MARKKVNKIEKFIKDNKLDFTGSGSDLNGNCVILAGYACYLELDWNELKELLWPPYIAPASFHTELERVFEYAYNNNYGKWWESEDAKKTYKF